jgi:isoquinoline 1-oxidoreductase subunit alpha
MDNETIKFIVNGKEVTVDVPGDMPLLWVLRDKLGLTGTKYGCGEGSCGSCTVHVNGEAAYSCIIPIAEVAGQEVTTIEGLSPDGLHPLQRAWIEEQVPQCGYCQPGAIMQAASLLARNSSPSREQIIEQMQSVICRCGTYLRMIRAIERAASEMKK